MVKKGAFGKPKNLPNTPICFHNGLSFGVFAAEVPNASAVISSSFAAVSGSHPCIFGVRQPFFELFVRAEVDFQVFDVSV